MVVPDPAITPLCVASWDERGGALERQSRSAPYAGEGVAEELRAKQNQDHHHDGRVVVRHELLDGGEWACGLGWGREIEGDRTDDGDRPDRDERKDRDRGTTPSNSVLAIAAAAAAVSARFLGLAPDSAAPVRTALMGETELIDAIQFGISGVSPCLGRFFQSRAAITRNRSPIPAMNQLMPVAAIAAGIAGGADEELQRQR